MNASPTLECPFCSVSAERVRETCALAFTVDDAFPVAPGHTLVIPRRHAADFFDLTKEEIASMIRLMRAAKERLDQSISPTGYTIGINVGRDAGQTVFHAHVHLIPRYPKDTPDPTGGVQNILPGKGHW
jgi:diadenosine tetraphosphate (Ap4A) HIT family hydrolase